MIGSATIREGIDLQKKSSVLYNCYLDWNPTDIKQLEGRIWRFGNMFSHVRIVVPLIENSFDIFLNQKLGEKTSRVNNIWSRSDRTTVLKLEDLNPDELKKGLITDPQELVKMVVEEQLQDFLIERDLYRGYVRQLGDAATEKSEVDRLWRKLETAAKGAKERYMYPSDFDGKAFAKIKNINEKTTTGIYRLVRAFAKTRGWNEKYELERSVDEHIKKLKKLERIERDILSKNDLSIQDDFEKLIGEYEAKILEVEKEIADTKSDKNKRKLLEEFIEEREEKDLNSKPLEARVREFERLNFLLECKDKVQIETENNVCDIYGINRGKGKKIIKLEPIQDTDETYRMSKKLKAFMPKHQRQVVRGWGEETRQDVLIPLEKQIESIPKSQGDVATAETIVHAHFFYAESDWFITEWVDESRLFGYTILNGDSVMSEWGYLSLDELTGNGRVELNFHWKPKYLPEAQYKADPNYFKKPTKVYKPKVEKKKDKSEAEKVKKLKLAKAKAAAQQQRIRILEIEKLSVSGLAG